MMEPGNHSQGGTEGAGICPAFDRFWPPITPSAHVASLLKTARFDRRMT